MLVRAVPPVATALVLLTGGAMAATMSNDNTLDKSAPRPHAVERCNLL